MAIWCGAVMMSATSAMKCTPQKIDVFRVGLRREARQLQRVAGQVGVLVDVGALVVMAEDDGLLAEPGAGGADALLAVRVGEVVEAVEAYRGGGHGSRETLNWRQESAVMKRSVGRDSISLPLRSSH